MHELILVDYRRLKFIKVCNLRIVLIFITYDKEIYRMKFFGNFSFENSIDGK